jgi:nascent polypeptide-associated complex subunit alpha
MFMLGGMDPKQMAKMMKQMGINTKEIAADRVIIEAAEEKIIIEEPQIVEIIAQGQSSFQISGKVRKEEKVNEEDVALIMEKTGVLREKAIEALKNAKGDLAEAILALQS